MWIYVLIGQINRFIAFHILSFLFWKKNLLKDICHCLLKVLKLVFCVVNHIIDDFHHKRRIVFILSDAENYTLIILFICSIISTNHGHKIKLTLSLIFNVRYRFSECYVRCFYFCLGILFTQKFQYFTGNVVNVIRQLKPFLLISEINYVFHKFNEVEDDVFCK